jgi:hypothetical protein
MTGVFLSGDVRLSRIAKKVPVMTNQANAFVAG